MYSLCFVTQEGICFVNNRRSFRHQNQEFCGTLNRTALSYSVRGKRRFQCPQPPRKSLLSNLTATFVPLFFAVARPTQRSSACKAGSSLKPSRAMSSRATTGCTIVIAGRDRCARGTFPDHIFSGEGRLALQSRLRLLLCLSPCRSILACYAEDALR